MEQKIRIKDIARLAGVSAGTVDRVLHNRGNVSPAARRAVEAVFEQVDYRPNIHLSGISLRRRYKIVAAIPEFSQGEYWECIRRGIGRAVEVYESLRIDCRFVFYDQFDLYSCREAFGRIAALSPDGVIIGPTFRDETVGLAARLDELGIPYVYVDSVIDGTSPLTAFAADPHTCGYLTGKLIDSITPPDAEFVLFQAVRVGRASANTTILRKQGLMDYLTEHGLANNLHRVPFSVMHPERNDELIGDFFERHPCVKGAVVLSSRSSVIAAYMDKHRIEGVKLVGVDLTENNCREIRRGYIDFVLGQRPEQQGYLAVKAMIHHLLYGDSAKACNVMPLDIVTRENLDLYSEFSEVAYSDAK